MRKNTRSCHIVLTAAFIISGIFNAIGIISDLFGFADGISEHGSAIRGVLSFLAARWRWTIGITVLLLALILYFRWKRKKSWRQWRP